MTRMSFITTAWFDRIKGEVLTPEQRFHRILGAAIGLAVILTSFFYDPHWGEQQGIILCVSRNLTGIPCPGCGLTRSFCALAHGHLGLSFSSHLFGPILGLLTLYLFGLWSLEAVLRRRLVNHFSWFWARPMVLILISSLVLYHLIRLGLMLHSGQLLAGMKSSLAGTALVWLLQQLNS